VRCSAFHCSPLLCSLRLSAALRCSDASLLCTALLCTALTVKRTSPTCTAHCTALPCSALLHCSTLNSSTQTPHHSTTQHAPMRGEITSMPRDGRVAVEKATFRAAGTLRWSCANDLRNSMMQGLYAWLSECLLDGPMSGFSAKSGAQLKIAKLWQSLTIFGHSADPHVQRSLVTLG
jgi:hypothetical protein